MHKVNEFSWANRKKLARGCQLCTTGEKTVLFITGICGKKCFYCPVSENKIGSDVIYVNEWPTKKVKDLIKEAELCESKGIGITGGDPLTRLARTCKFIKKLKSHFGKDFHIHLYTPLLLVTSNVLEKLYAAGLDEIRFHPDLDSDELWYKLELAKDFDWDVGVEIPVIPNKLKITKKLIKFAHDKIDFLNLNELEVSDTNANKIIERGFNTKDRISYAIKGSQEMAFKLIEYAKKFRLSAHFCTAKFKDKVQMANRFKRRAKNIAEPFDFVDNDGMISRGVIYTQKPSTGYRKKLKLTESKKTIENLKKIRKQLMNQFKIPAKLIKIDEKKQRILTSGGIVEEFKNQIKKLNLIPAIVEEDPTWDALEIEIDFL